MASDYAAIRRENVQRYGTDIGRIGPMLLADRYDDRTHFIFELLQNAEDALKRREGHDGPRSVTFALSERDLRVSHYGKLFNEADVRGICGIAESTKDLTAIGRFGIGFKSVYAFTDRPEIHSGDEHFAIDSFVWPRAIPAVNGVPGETAFILPLRPTDASAREEIAAGLRRLGPRTLLFLRELEEISWSVKGGASGLYLRSEAERVAANARKVVVIGEEQGAAEVTEETWLVFSRDVLTSDSVRAGSVEVAFVLGKSDDGASPSVQPIDDSALVVFFPTIVPTNLGLLVQGPYRTTPSRDNVPRNDPWNQHLVQETTTVLVGALRGLRDMGLLDAGALRSLPLDRSKFGEGSMFATLFEAVREALSTEVLLPRFGGGHVPASAARLGRTHELRELFSPTQLTDIFQTKGEIAWLSKDITQDRTPELRRYLMLELEVVEVIPETILPKLTKPFLEAQNDEWIVQLYEFLNGQPALQRQNRLNDVPLIRLENGDHVTARKNGQPQAFLPGAVSTGFPTVRRAVCGADNARALLQALGLTEPDPVDDVIRNVLPKYQGVRLDVLPDAYAADIQCVLNAFATDSKSRRDTLVSALRECRFLAVVDAGTGVQSFAQPTQAYLATEHLKALFEGGANVLLVDNSHECLRGESVRDLLEACGASRYLQPLRVDSQFTWEELREMRRRGRCESCSYEQGTEDFTLRGLQEILKMLPSLDAEQAKVKAELLWKALRDVEDRRGARAFSGTYRWTYYHLRSYEFDAAFVRQLNDTAWVPARDAKLQPPACVSFEETGWAENPFLLSKIRFKPPIIEALAREAGFEPGVLALLKKLGVTSEAELKARLGIKDEASQPERMPNDGDLSPDEALLKLGIPPTTPAVAGDEPESGSAGGSRVVSRAGDAAGTTGDCHKEGKGSGGGGRQSTPTPGLAGRGGTSGGDTPRPFISYLGVHPDEDEPDPDGLEKERMALEEQAIRLILRQEPKLSRTRLNNPGFDLVENGVDGQPVRWVEVKAMAGTLQRRPVGVSRKQFDSAQEHGDRYWLYVVERAGSSENARIVRIQDPAGMARTFTFDHGWLTVAEAIDSAEPSPKSIERSDARGKDRNYEN